VQAIENITNLARLPSRRNMPSGASHDQRNFVANTTKFRKSRNCVF
jgi:hypothetical protein